MSNDKKDNISEHLELNNPFSERRFYITEKMDKTYAIYEQRIDELESGY